MIPKHVFQSSAWDALAKHVQGEIESLRVRNDSHMPEHQTAELRGRIGALRDLLGLASAPPEPTRVVPDLYDT